MLHFSAPAFLLRARKRSRAAATVSSLFRRDPGAVPCTTSRAVAGSWLVSLVSLRPEDASALRLGSGPSCRMSSCSSGGEGDDDRERTGDREGDARLCAPPLGAARVPSRSPEVDASRSSLPPWSRCADTASGAQLRDSGSLLTLHTKAPGAQVAPGWQRHINDPITIPDESTAAPWCADIMVGTDRFLPRPLSVCERWSCTPQCHNAPPDHTPTMQPLHPTPSLLAWRRTPRFCGNFDRSPPCVHVSPPRLPPPLPLCTWNIVEHRGTLCIASRMWPTASVCR